MKILQNFAIKILLFTIINLFGLTLCAQDRCASTLNITKLRQKNPDAYQRFIELEKFTDEYRKQLSDPSNRLINQNAVITIPVVVHIVHNGVGLGVGRNIPDVQVFNQINILNQDFRRLNPDRNLTPAAFNGIVGNPIVEFRLACRDPNGNVTNGINRVTSTTNTFNISGVDSPVKHTNQGGIDAWPTNRYLNIWVCDIGQSILGAATFPSDFNSNPNIDGVMIDFQAFGSGGNSVAPFDLGRTATHEIGHWLNLIHIWGDDGSDCSGTDNCNDTPNQGGFTSPLITPIFPNRTSCSNAGDMFMNYMDYSADRFMNLFTLDQIVRMRAVFQTGGPRASFIDNYFKLVFSGYRNCIEEFDYVASPFCEAAGNIAWTITGPASISNSQGFSTYVNPYANNNGVAVLTASWNNFRSDLSIPVGYGMPTGSYTPNYPSSGYVPLTVNQVHSTGYNKYTYGQVSFTGATGVAQNWRFLTNSSSTTTISGGNSNSFWIRFTQAGAFATIRADIPTSCGLRTVDYSFTTSGGTGFALSPNPASNNIKIQASKASSDSNTSTSDMPEYDVNIYTSYNQLVKKAKCPKGNGEVTIDVSSFVSNQFYTVQLISVEGVQTISFFKE